MNFEKTELELLHEKHKLELENLRTTYSQQIDLLETKYDELKTEKIRLEKQLKDFAKLSTHWGKTTIRLGTTCRNTSSCYCVSSGKRCRIICKTPPY